MAAADEFPRGLWLTTGEVGGGPTAVATFPAVAGIAWVLREIDAAFVTVAALSLGVKVLVTNNCILGFMVMQTDTASPYGMSTWSWSGAIAYPAGTAVSVTFDTATTGGTAEFLNVYAEPT